MKSFKFRIYPTKKQENSFRDVLFSCFKLYNVALEHRREVYRINRKSISYREQQNELPDLKKEIVEYASIHSQVLQNVLSRVDLAFNSFFRRVKTKSKRVGFPRYKSLDRYDSFCFPQGGFYIRNNKLQLYKIGLIKVKFHRNITDGCKTKTCTIKREGGKWYVIFSCEVPNCTPKNKTINSSIGIDLGLTNFAVLSNGEKIRNPKYLKQSTEKLKLLHRKYSKNKSKKTKRQLSNIHSKVTNQRRDFQHKLSTNLVNTFDLIAYEDLNIKQMIGDNRHNLQKHISDASWGTFISMIKYKAESAGTYAIAVDPKGTTQKCSYCGTVVRKTLYERLHTCSCGFSSTRDHNAALNIHKLGISLVGNYVCSSMVHPFYLPKPMQLKEHE